MLFLVATAPFPARPPSVHGAVLANKEYQVRPSLTAVRAYPSSRQHELCNDKVKWIVSSCNVVLIGSLHR